MSNVPSNEMSLVDRLRDDVVRLSRTDVVVSIDCQEAYEEIERLRSVLYAPRGSQLIAKLNNVAVWLKGGCDPQHAVTELGLICDWLQGHDDPFSPETGVKHGD